MRSAPYETAEEVLKLVKNCPREIFFCLRPVTQMVIEELLREIDHRDQIDGLTELFDVPVGAAKAMFDAKNVWMERATKAEEKLGGFRGRLQKSEKAEKELRQRVHDLERWVSLAREFLLNEMPDMLRDAEQANFHAGLIHTVPLDRDYEPRQGRWVYVVEEAS